MWGKKVASGIASIENCEIFHYLKEQKIISLYFRHIIVLDNLDWAKTNRFKFDSEEHYLKVKKRWEREIFSKVLSKIICLACVSIYPILKFFHLQ
jgi:hypothetical protein